MTTEASLVDRLNSPVDWAHFVSDDHANDYADERREAAAEISRLQSALEARTEECAAIAHNHGRYSQAYIDDEPPADVVTHNCACWAIRDAIRKLQEQS